MTQDQFNQSMTESYTRPKDPNTMYLSPKFTDSTQSIMTDYGPREVSGKKLTGLTQSGADIAKAKKEIAAKEKTFAASGDTVQSTLPDKGESLLPDPKLEGKSFKDKLNSVADKIFNMQSNNPEAYASMLSGLDLYSRSQTQDFATAMLGNNKYNKDQAAALMQANMNATNQKLMDMKVLKAEKDMTAVPIATKGELEIAKNIIANDVDKDDIEGVANFVAGKAKELQGIASNQNLSLGYNEALVIAYQQLQASGGLKDTSTFRGRFGKELKINPDAVTGPKTRSLSELKSRPSNKGISDAEIRAKVEAAGLTLID
jgi:hypothetical protein